MAGTTTGGLAGNVTTVDGTLTLGAGNQVGGSVNMNNAGTLNMGTAGTISGSVNTGTLTYASYSTPVTFNVSTRTGPGFSGALGGAFAVVGSAGSDTIMGNSVTWTIAGANAGTGAGINWSSFENLTDTGSASISGNGSVAGNIAVTGNASLSGSLAAGGNLSVGGNATLSGILSSNANLSVGGTTAMNSVQITSGGSQTYTGAVTARRDDELRPIGVRRDQLRQLHHGRHEFRDCNRRDGYAGRPRGRHDKLLRHRLAADRRRAATVRGPHQHPDGGRHRQFVEHHQFEPDDWDDHAECVESFRVDGGDVYHRAAAV